MTNRELVLAAVRRLGRAEALSVRESAVSGTLDGTGLVAAEGFIPRWRPGAYDEVGAPVRFNGQVYKVWQTHDSTENPDWTPEGAVSLFDVQHTSDPALAKPYVAPQGARGAYQAGECCTVTSCCSGETETFRSLQDSNVWAPADYPESWEKIG